MRFPIRNKDETIRFIDAARIYYLEAQGDDILIRTRSKRLLTSVERLSTAEARLKTMGDFARVHRSVVVNLAHVRAMRPRGNYAFAIQLDPPVNQWLPVTRSYIAALRRRLKV